MYDEYEHYLFITSSQFDSNMQATSIFNIHILYVLAAYFDEYGKEFLIILNF